MKPPFVSWLPFIFCCWIILSVYISLVAGQCLEDQRSLLLQLKNDLMYEHSSSLASWNQHPDCCEWPGVSCDSEGHVVSLDLSKQNITGEISNSSSLFGLEYLQDLDLAYNHFNSVIPSGFHNLANLINLNLSNARFAGQIPLEISHLTKLVTLDISCYLVDCPKGLKLENPNLQYLVQNLTSLKKLYLDGVDISAQGQEWCRALWSLSSLQELSMQYCYLSGPIDSLAKLKHLLVIRLDGNNLSSSVLDTFANFENLTTLSLSVCNLRGMFPGKIFQLGTLSFIDISSNEYLHGFLPDFPLNGSLKTLRMRETNFSGPIPNSIGSLKQLSVLDLSSCHFNGTLPVSMSKLTQLVELDLSFNRFVGPIPSLNKCKKLVHVLLSNNNFTGPLSSAHFEGLLNLVDIDLQNNFITGQIPSSLFVLPSLQVIQLSNNKFTGKVELNMIQKLGNLTVLDLSYNNLSVIGSRITFPSSSTSITWFSLVSCQLTTFPEFLKNQSHLAHLDISNNYLTGTIPHWLSNYNFLGHLNLSYNHLTDWEEPLLNMSILAILDLQFNHLQSLPVLPQSLTSLDCSHNNLSSFIPPYIGNHHFPSLTYISFSSNNLHGNIPESLCYSPRLLVLDLSGNYLTGTIPKCLITMNGTLSVLNLRRNQLTGTIESFPGLCDLRTLDLNGNFLQGKLPKYLGNCQGLEILDLGNNYIDDEFPCWLKSIANLHVVILRSNKFHGSINCPGTEVAWPYLHIIDLSLNNFSGRIPPKFFEPLKVVTGEIDYTKVVNIRPFVDFFYRDEVTVTSKNLQMELVKIPAIFTYIDLSGSKFEGPIPTELGQLRALVMLNMSDNAFSGNIPSSFGNLKLLESLDLSNNSLTGEIPVQMAILSFLSFLNLSHNHLAGRIPSGTQIQSFEASSFVGNDGLCGPPLTPNCSTDEIPGTTQSSIKKSNSESSIDWNFLSAELGFVFGIGIVLLPLVFWKPWRIWYWQHVDRLLHRIFPQLDFVYECRGGKNYRTLRWKSY